MRRCALLAAFACLCIAPHAAGASMIVDRNVSNAHLRVDANGVALVTYTSAAGRGHVLFWGAQDWKAKFRRDYSGGWKSKRADWQHFHNVCKPYTGPALPLLVEACDAPDGSHWALQAWERLWNNYGGDQAPEELHLSHWTGDIGQLQIWTDWGYNGRYEHLWGGFTYHGKPVFGNHWTRSGVPLDSKGRNIYLDYHQDDRWYRENSFLTHPATGAFCYLFGHHAGRVAHGDAYRATVQGPGVSPLVQLQFAPPGPFDASADATANAQQESFLGDDPRCVVN